MGLPGKTGVVSPVFTLDDSYAVALLTGIKEEGTMSLEDARAQLEMAVRKEKKQQKLSQDLVPITH